MVAALAWLSGMIRRLRPPLGLLGMLALVGAVEATLVQYRGAFVTPAAEDWRFAAWAAERKAPGSDVLCFGDSLVKYGVLPRVIEGRSHLRTYNLATSGGTMPTQFFLLEQALAAGARPRAVVADFAALMIHDEPTLTLHNFPELATLAEGVELARVAGDLTFLGDLIAAKVLPSYRWRFESRNLIRTALNGQSGSRQAETTNARYHWENHRGAQPMHPGRTHHPREDYLIDGVCPADWAIEPRNATYLDRFLSLARARGITVYWLIPPLTPEVQARRERRGTNTIYDRLVERKRQEFPNMVVLDARRSGYADDVYIDHIHLDRVGATTLSHDIADALLAPLQPAAWVALPPFGERPLVATGPSSGAFTR